MGAVNNPDCFDWSAHLIGKGFLDGGSKFRIFRQAAEVPFTTENILGY